MCKTFISLPYVCCLWCYLFSVNMPSILENNCSKRNVLYMCIITGFTVSVGWIHTATSSAIDHGCSGNSGRTVSISPTWDIRTEAAWHCGGGWNTGKELVPPIETMCTCVTNFYIWLQRHLLSGRIMKKTAVISCNYSCMEENCRGLLSHIC